MVFDRQETAAEGQFLRTSFQVCGPWSVYYICYTAFHFNLSKNGGTAL